MGNDRQRLTGFLILGVIIALVISQSHVSNTTVIYLFLLLPTVICHEVAHGLVAYMFGDDTAKNAGRLTANPVKHIDLVGTILLPGLLLATGLPPFGYAKPVPVSLNKLRDPRFHGLLVGLAGPFTNFFLTIMSIVTMGLMWSNGVRTTGHPAGPLELMFYFGILNIFIGVFNLLPIPPLDGSSILEFFLPDKWKFGYYNFRRYAMFILLFLVLAANGLLGNILQKIDRPFIDKYVNAVARVTSVDATNSIIDSALR